MNAERIRAAAEWARQEKEFQCGHRHFQRPDIADAALILGKLAAGEWVLCAGEPLAWRNWNAYTGEPWVSFDQDSELASTALHARIPEE